MIRWYVWPLVVTSDGMRGPKYLDWHMTQPGVPGPHKPDKWNMVDYGLMNTALLVADASTDLHAIAAGQPDIVALPENLDSLISPAALPQVVAALESLHIPAGWVTTAHSYRDVVRRVAHLFLFAQRYNGITKKKIVESGYTLDTTISSLPVAVVQSLNDTAQSLGYDTSSVTGAWTLRQALVYLADQWGVTPVIFGSLGTI